jgi:hypothetical protein
MASVYYNYQAVLDKSCDSMGQSNNNGKKEALDYNIDNLDVLNIENISQHCSTQKFAMNIFGPFKIDRIISAKVIHLKLLELKNICLGFYTKFLESFRV